MAALLQLDGSPLVGATTLALEVTAKAEHSLGLVGNWQALFSALGGELNLSRGAVKIAGEEGRGLVLDLELGLMRAHSEWPMSRTGHELLELSAELLGCSQADSRALAREALASLGLAELAKVRLDRLTRIDLRLVDLAHAVLGRPQILALEDPFSGLDPGEQEVLAKALAVARANRKWIVNVPTLSGQAWAEALLDGCEELLVLEGGVLGWQGAPQAFKQTRRLYVMTLSGRLEQVAQELGRKGVTVHASTQASKNAAPGLASGHLVVELSADDSTRLLLEAVHAESAVLLELRSLER